MISLVSIIGIMLALFIPGFLTTLILFKEESFLERIILSVALSIMISTTIGIALGYNQDVKNITGGVTQRNLLVWEASVAGFLFILALVVNINIIKNIMKLGQKVQIKSKKVSEKEIIEYKKL